MAKYLMKNVQPENVFLIGQPEKEAHGSWSLLILKEPLQLKPCES